MKIDQSEADDKRAAELQQTLAEDGNASVMDVDLSKPTWLDRSPSLAPGGAVGEAVLGDQSRRRSCAILSCFQYRGKYGTTVSVQCRGNGAAIFAATSHACMAQCSLTALAVLHLFHCGWYCNVSLAVSVSLPNVPS